MSTTTHQSAAAHAQPNSNAELTTQHTYLYTDQTQDCADTPSIAPTCRALFSLLTPAPTDTNKAGGLILLDSVTTKEKDRTAFDISQEEVTGGWKQTDNENQNKPHTLKHSPSDFSLLL